MTQTLLRGDGDAFRHLPPGAGDAEVEAAADAAFAPTRWRRPVVKEVLPLLGAWLMARHAPAVVDLERHPVAIGASHLRLGWGPAERERDRLPAGPPGARLRALWPQLDDLGRKVAYVGAVREHVRSTWGHEALHTRYEDLLDDPDTEFERLRSALGLGPVTLDVRDEGPDEGPYSLRRRPRPYPPTAASPELREVWEQFDTGSYRADADWG